MESNPLTTALSLLAYLAFAVAVLLWFALSSDHSEQKEGQAWAKTQKMGVAGELASWRTEEGVLSDTTVLVLKDGTQIRVDGRFNVIKPGAAVVFPLADSPEDWRFYCVSGECRRLSRY